MTEAEQKVRWPVLLLVGVFIFLAAAGAGVFVWTLCLAALALACGYLLLGVNEPGPASVRAVERASLAIIAFLFLTVLPLPLRVSALPHTARLQQNERVAETIVQAGDAGAIREAPRTLFSLTRNRAGTMRLALLASAALAAAMLAALLPQVHKVPYLRFLAAAGAVIAALGYLGQWRIPQTDRLWWFIPIPHHLPGPVACFVNRNHFAGFVAMLCPLSLTLFAYDVAKRRWIAALASAAGLIVMTLAVLFSLSRGALLAWAAGIALTAVLFAIVRRRIFPLVLSVALGALVTILALASDAKVRDRLGTLFDLPATGSFLTRTAAWRDSLTIWRAYPLIGCGANGFRAVYPQFRQTSAREYSTHASSEYIQLLAEGGFAGLILFAWLAIAAAKGMRSDAAPRPDRDLIRIAVAGAGTVAAVHALGDFALHVPLYAVALASLAGLTLERRTSPDNGAAWIPWPALACVLAVIVLTPAWRGMQRLDDPGYLRTASASSVCRALAGQPTAWQPWYEFARHVSVLDTPEARTLAHRCASQAAEYDPNNYRLWLALGNYRMSLKDFAGARTAFSRVRELRSWVNIPVVPEE